MISEADYLKTLTKFEQRAYAKSLGYTLGDVVFKEVESCLANSSWDQGAGFSANRDMPIGDVFDNSYRFVMDIITRMIDNDKG